MLREEKINLAIIAAVFIAVLIFVISYKTSCHCEFTLNDGNKFTTVGACNVEDRETNVAGYSMSSIHHFKTICK
jgi:hypothetical protein